MAAGRDRPGRRWNIRARDAILTGMEIGARGEGMVLRRVLRELRKQAGLRQRDVADALGKPQSFVSKYESGDRRLDLLEVRAVARVCGVSLEEVARQLEDRLGP